MQLKILFMIQNRLLCLRCNTLASYWLFAVQGLLTSAILLLISSCGGTGSAVKPPPLAVAPTITTQPASQTMLLGRSATFSVAASGTAPLLYQWYKNGASIENATAASYTTPIVAQADNNTTYYVTVSNSAGNVTSSTATLFAGPRAPAIGDLRYLQWEQVPLLSEINSVYGGELTNFYSQISQSFQQQVGSPLDMGTYVDASAGQCVWSIATSGIAPNAGNLPTILTYTSGNLDSNSGQTYAQYLQSIAASNTVVLSMDLQPSCQLIGVNTISTSRSTEPSFDQRIELVDPANLQKQAATDGAASRIVTAVTFDGSVGKFVLLSYGWQGDTSSAYEAKAFIAQPSDVLTDAESLANQGYFISAFGGSDQSGYAVIGMRVMGDTAPRPWSADMSIGVSGTPIKGNQPATADPAPYTFVSWLQEYSPTSPLTVYDFFEQ